MTPRQRFIQIVSYGPSKLPLSFVVEAFDIAMKETDGYLQAPSIVLDNLVPAVSNAILESKEQIIASYGHGTSAPIGGALSFEDAEKLAKSMQIQAGLDGMSMDEDQENADALENLARVTEEKNGQ